MISSTTGGGVSCMPMTDDVKQPLQQQFPPCVPTVAAPSTNTRSSHVETYLSRQSMGLGITLIIVGALAVIFNCVGFAVSDELAVVSHGIFCGVMFIITGSFGVAAKTKNKCLIVTFMILAIISATMTSFLLTVGLVGAAVNRGEGCGHKDYGYDACDSYRYYYDDDMNGTFPIPIACCSYTPPCHRAAIAMEVLLAILALVAAIVSIWGSAICCRAVCCCSRSSIVSYNGGMVSAPYGNQPYVFFVDQQQMNGSAFIASSQIIPGPPAYEISAKTYPIHCWAAPPNQQQGQSNVFATMQSPNNGIMSTVSGTLMTQPNCNVSVLASAPTSQQYNQI